MDTVDKQINSPVHQESTHRDRIRTFTVFTFILIALVIVGYSILFTKNGNRIIKPLVQNQLESILQHPITLQIFFLDFNNFALDFNDEANNSIQAKGVYTLIPPSVDAHYDLNLSKSAGLNTLELPLTINGTVKGGYSQVILSGKVNVFQGWSDYNATLLFTSLDSINLKLHHIQYQDLMNLLEYPHYSDTLIDGTITLNGLSHRNINADLSLRATTTHFTPSPIMEDDNESFDFWSLLADHNGKIKPFTINAKIKTQVDELGILEQFASYPLKTDGSLEGTLQGTQHQLLLDAHAKAAQSDTHIRLTLHKLRPNKLQIDIKHADIPSLFTLLSLPAPITGMLNASVNSDFSTALLSLEIQKARTQSAILKRDYGLTQPDMTFDSNVKLILSPKERHYLGTFTSDLKNIPFEASPSHDQMLQELLRQLQQNRPKGKI